MSDPTPWDAYFWPGTEVLANKVGIRDAQQLERVEYELTAARQEEIEAEDVSVLRTFDAQHLAELHRHLFGDLYEWAGRWRTVNMSKGLTDFAAVPWEVDAQLADAAQVARSTDWAGADRAGFVAGVSRCYAHLNHAHPFREGNGRAGKLLVDQLAERSRFAVDWDAVSPAWWNHASAASHPEPFSGRRPDPASLMAVFDGMTVDREPPAEPGPPGPVPSSATSGSAAGATPRRGTR